MKYRHVSLVWAARNTLLWVGLCLIGIQCMAQQPSTDKLWLRSGAEVEGTILLPLQGDLLKIIRAAEGDTLHIFKQDIARIEQQRTYEIDAFYKVHQAPKDPKVFNDKDMYGMLQVLGGTGDKGLLGAGIAAGYRWNSGLETGLSVHYYGIQEWTDGIIPIGLDARMPLSASRSGRFSSLIQLNSGFAWSNAPERFYSPRQVVVQAGDGFYFQPGLQFRMNITRQFGLIWDIAYLRNARPLVNVLTRKTELWEGQHFLLTRLGFLL